MSIVYRIILFVGKKKINYRLTNSHKGGENVVWSILLATTVVLLCFSIMVLRSLGMASGDMEPPTRRSRAQDIPMVMHRFVFQPATPENDGTLSTPAILTVGAVRGSCFFGPAF